MNEQYFLRPSKIYALLKKFVSFVYGVFYNTVSVEGLENVPEDVPVIFAPNHQNALMDALAIIVHTRKQPVFMAKADIFKANVLRKVLNTLKIIPVYRIRDGIDNLSNNDESFLIVQHCLFTKNNVGIMPEGTQTDKQQLQPLKKGFARLAFSAQELIGDKTGVVVVPVGLHYSNFYNFRANVSVSFGKPIEVKGYFDLYKENPQKAYNELKDRLASELKQLMVSIDNEQYYELILGIKDIVSGELALQKDKDGTYLSRVKVEKQVSDCLSGVLSQNSELAAELSKYYNEYSATKRRYNLVDEVFENKYPPEHLIFDVIRYFIFFPFAFFGAVFNALPAFLTHRLSLKTDDTQFISSIKFGIGSLAFLLYYILFLLTPIPLIVKVLMVITMPVLGILAFDYFKGLHLFITSIKYRNAINRNDPGISRLVYVRSQIIKRVKACLGEE